MYLGPAYSYICVLIPLYMLPQSFSLWGYLTGRRPATTSEIRNSVHIILCMCPHTTVYVSRCQYLYFGTSKARKLNTKYLQSFSLWGFLTGRRPATKYEIHVQRIVKSEFKTVRTVAMPPPYAGGGPARRLIQKRHGLYFRFLQRGRVGRFSWHAFWKQVSVFSPPFLVFFFICQYFSRFLRGRVGRFSWHALWTHVSAFGTRFTCFTSPKVQILRGRVGKFSWHAFWTQVSVFGSQFPCCTSTKVQILTTAFFNFGRS